MCVCLIIKCWLKVLIVCYLTVITLSSSSPSSPLSLPSSSSLSVLDPFIKARLPRRLLCAFKSTSRVCLPELIKIWVASMSVSVRCPFLWLGCRRVSRQQSLSCKPGAHAFTPRLVTDSVNFRLSIAAKRMASQNVLVKDLQGVETLGALTLLATGLQYRISDLLCRD